jgi:hypothetical protein
MPRKGTTVLLADRPVGIDQDDSESSAKKDKRAKRSWRGAGAMALVVLVFALRLKFRNDIVVGGVSVPAGVIGETFMLLSVALALGVFVDRRVKVDLSREISGMTMSQFFREFLGGRVLPDEYFQRLREFASIDMLSSGVTWRLELSWSDQLDKSGNPYLKVASTLHDVFRNIGRVPQNHGS